MLFTQICSILPDANASESFWVTFLMDFSRAKTQPLYSFFFSWKVMYLKGILAWIEIHKLHVKRIFLKWPQQFMIDFVSACTIKRCLHPPHQLWCLSQLLYFPVHRLISVFSFYLSSAEWQGDCCQTAAVGDEENACLHQCSVAVTESRCS